MLLQETASHLQIRRPKDFMRKVFGMLIVLTLLSATGTLLQAGDRYRDRRDRDRNVQVIVTTPYGGGYFGRGDPYYGRYVERGYPRYLSKREQKRYYKELRKYRRGYVNYRGHDHDRHCHHRH
jgi:hypothetical protein